LSFFFFHGKGVIMSKQTIPMKEFQNQFTRVLQELTEPDEQILVHEMLRNNGVRNTGCCIRRTGSDISSVFCLEECYRAVQEGEEIGSVARRMLTEARSSLPAEEFQPGMLEDYDHIRGRLALKLIGTQHNQQLLKEVPYVKMEDMALVCYFFVGQGGEGYGTVLIHNHHIKTWGVSRDRLMQDAWASMKQLLPARIRGITEVLGIPPREGIAGEQDAEDMYVISNRQDYLGAVCVLYPGVLKSFASSRNCNLYVLPSSIHEMILVPEEPGMDYTALEDIVRDINQTEVAPEEVLTDSVYYFDRNKGNLVRAVR